MKNISTILILIVILGIIAAIGIVWYGRKPGTKQEIKVQHDSVLISKAQIKAIQVREIILLAKLESDSLKHAERIQSQETTIKRLFKKLAENRPEVVAQIDSLPDVESFVITQDSLIQSQAVEIDTLKEQKVKQWQAFNKILTVADDKFKASQELNDHLAKINDLQANETKRVKKQNVFLKVGIGILAVLVLVK